MFAWSSRYKTFICILLLGLWMALNLHQAQNNDRYDLTVLPSEQREQTEADDAEISNGALEFYLLKIQDENGKVAFDGTIKANQQIAMMINAEKSDLTSNSMVSSPPLSWTWLGPANIGGYLGSIVISPINTNNIWVGSRSGGIWKTTNAGASWDKANDFLPNLAIASMAINPVDSNILYAGIGGPPFQGNGIYKSTDSGNSWNILPATAPLMAYAHSISISANGGTILAATENGIWRSTDSGATWTRTFNGQGFDYWNQRFVKFDPNNNAKASASGYRVPPLSNPFTPLYSTNGGVSWSAASVPSSSMGLGFQIVAYSKSDSSIVYATNGVYPSVYELWKSIDGGVTYSMVNSNVGFYSTVLWVDPTNPNIIVAGALDLWRSTNGGVTFTKISEWWHFADNPQIIISPHADHRYVIESPNFNGGSDSSFFTGTDGGIYKTANIYTVTATTGWQNLNHNLGVTEFYGAGGNPTSGLLWGGTQDNGTLQYNFGLDNWNVVWGGDGGFAAIDSTDSSYKYGEWQEGNIFRVRNGCGGFCYETISAGITDTVVNFIAPFILDPNNPSIMLAGRSSLWKSANVKAVTPSWSLIKPPHPENDKISAIAVAPGNSNVIWVGYNGGDIYKTTNGTTASPTWIKVDSNSPVLPNRFVARITIDKNNSSKIYASFGGYSPDNIWRTTDGGLTWNDVTGVGVTGLPDVPVNSLAIHPDDSNRLYVGTSNGVFRSEDGGVNWYVFNDGLANVNVSELFWLDKSLFAATFGRGVYKIYLGGIPKQVFLPLVCSAC